LLTRGDKKMENTKQFIYTKEFEDLIIQFEKNIIKDIPMYGSKIERVGKNEKVPKGIYYNDGRINTIFIAYMHGYQFGKLAERLEQ
jgi:hypothetical protein